MRSLLDRLLPRWLLEQPAARAKLSRWLLLGLLLRLLFMPFAVHNDFLSEHWRAGRVAFGGVIYPKRLDVLSHYLDALTLRILAPLIPEHERLFWSPSAEGQPFPRATIDDYVQFTQDPQVNRAIFLTKIPYLIFDLIAAWILLFLFADAQKAIRAFKYWLLNPVVIFAAYIFGRYETYALATVLLSMLLLHRRHARWGAIALGIAVLFRGSVLLLLPVYAMAAERKWSQRLLLALLSLLPTAGLILVMEGLLGLSPAFASASQLRFLRILLAPIQDIKWHPYVIGYVLLVMTLHFGMSEISALRRYTISGLFVYLLMLMFTHHSPAYYAWIMPFLVWLIGEDAAFGQYFLWQFAAWSFFWLMATDVGVFTPYLFSPLSSYMRELCPTPILLEKFSLIGLNRDHMVYIGRSVLAAVSIWIAAAAIRRAITWTRQGDA